MLLLRELAKEGHQDAQFNLAMILFDEGNWKEDKVEAAKLFKMVAEKGDAVAQFKFAECLQNGIGIDANPVEAEKFYRQAAKQGETRSQFRLGLSLLKNAKTKSDAEKAFRGSN